MYTHVRIILYANLRALAQTSVNARKHLTGKIHDICKDHDYNVLHMVSAPHPCAVPLLHPWPVTSLSSSQTQPSAQRKVPWPDHDQHPQTWQQTGTGMWWWRRELVRMMKIAEEREEEREEVGKKEAESGKKRRLWVRGREWGTLVHVQCNRMLVHFVIWNHKQAWNC